MSMQKLAGTPLLLMLLLDPTALAATKQDELPDREMLRMIDFLRDWEMIKNMEMMRELQAMEQAGDRGSKTATQKTLPGVKKERVK